MVLKHRQKKTLKRKRRFLKRKSLKTYRRSLTKRRSMRGGHSTTWKVNVKYKAITSTNGTDDSDENEERTSPGTFTFLNVPDHEDLYNNKKVGTLILPNKPGGNYVDATWKPSFIPDNDMDVYMGKANFGSALKMGDLKILSFEKIDESTSTTGETGETGHKL